MKHPNTKHGKYGTIIYRIWLLMKARCHNPNERRYKYYGGRGIKVCERWQTFANFYADMGDRPSKKYSLERKDNNGDYSPENCKWATMHEQSRNRRSNRNVTFNGETKCTSDWAEQIGITHESMTKRLRQWSLERALTEPKYATV